jgi:hypothetical protein
MKKTVVAIIFLFVVSTQAQDSPGLPAGEFTESQLAVAATYENYLTSLNGASISTTNLLDIDIFVDELQFQQLRTALTFDAVLRAELGDDLTTVDRIRLDIEIEDAFPELSLQQRSALVDAIVAGEPIGAKLAAVVSQAYGIGNFTFQELILNASNPSSPTQRAVKDIIKNSLLQHVVPRPNASGDWFENVYGAVDYSYSDYENTAYNTDGEIHYKALTLGGTLFKDTELSVSLSHDEVDQKGSYALESETWTITSSVHHSFNDTWGAGLFGFYSLSDLEGIDSNAYTVGGGALGTFYHQFDNGYEFSSVQTLSYSTTSYTEDTLYMGLYKVAKQWTDWFNGGVYTYLSHTLDTSYEEVDDTYVSIGADAHFELEAINPTSFEGMQLSISYESVQELNDYRQNTYFVSYTYNF